MLDPGYGIRLDGRGRQILHRQSSIETSSIEDPLDHR